MRIVIIDDEVNARQSVVRIINQAFDDVEVAGEAGDIETGLEVLKREKPDVLLLDIGLPDGSGFDLLEQLHQYDFKLIFITAYEEYAIKAFRFSALDYLLKPFDPEDVKIAFNRARSVIRKEETQLKLNAFLANMENITNEVKKIVLRTSDSIHLVNVKDIMHCRSDGNYTHIHIAPGKKLLVSRTLKEFDNLLTPYGFFRIHQSHLANLNYMDYFNREYEHVVLRDGTSLPVSSRRKDQLLKVFRSMG